VQQIKQLTAVIRKMSTIFVIILLEVVHMLTAMCNE